MKQTLKSLAHYLGFLIVGIILITVYKTFDNLGLIVDGIKNFLGILSPFFVGLGFAFILHAPSSWLEKKIIKIKTGKDGKRAEKTAEVNAEKADAMGDSNEENSSEATADALKNKEKKPKQSLVVKYARGISVVVIYLLTFGILALAIVFAVPAIIKGVTGLANSFPQYSQNLIDFINPLFEKGGLLEKVNLETNLSDIFSKYIQPHMTPDAIFSSFKNVLSFTSSILNVLMAFIISIYMLLSKESLLRTIRTFFGLFFGEKKIKAIGHYGRKSADIMYTYLYSQLLDAFVVTILMSIGCFIAGAPSPILLGLLIGLTNMIPYFGAIIGGAVVILIMLVSKGGFWTIFLAVWIIVMQQLDANFIQPKIIGDTVGIKPIYVLLAITVGGGLLGFWGIFFGVPLITILQLFFRDIVIYRNKKKREKEFVKESGLPPDSLA